MKVKFIPMNIELETTPEKTLLQLALENNIEIKSICKGVPSCAECRIRITEGESNVIPPSKAELSLIGTNYYIDSRRLACQVRCFGPVTIDMTEQLKRQENQTKKIRGFKSEKPIESKAVLDTMLLTEQPPETDSSASKESQQGEGQPQQRSRSHENSRQNQEPSRNRQAERSKQQAQGRNRDQQRNSRQQNQQRSRPQDQQKSKGAAQGQGRPDRQDSQNKTHTKPESGSD